MKQSWPQIVDYFRWLRDALEPSPNRDAVDGIERLASYIDSSELATALFGWTSMHDLCIQQTDVDPQSGPYLRVSPKHNGTVEFRYIDTNIEKDQWQRTETPDATIARLDHFLAQLHWRIEVRTGR